MYKQKNVELEKKIRTSIIFVYSVKLFFVFHSLKSSRGTIKGNPHGRFLSDDIRCRLKDYLNH